MRAKLRLSNFDGQERRSRSRFPIQLGVRYTVNGQQIIIGTGWTVNVSSGGLLIASTHQVRPGTSINVVVAWPILQGDVCPLTLNIHGRVVRLDPGPGYNLIAVKFSTCEWRTQRKPIN